MKNPYMHENFVPAYQIAGVPYVTSSAANEVSTTPIQVTFPYVTRWIQVFNTDGIAADTMRVGFTENGVKATSGANYLILSGAQSTERLELKCTSLWFRQHGGPASFSVIAGLTSVAPNNFTVVTGSNGYDGVG